MTPAQTYLCGLAVLILLALAVTGAERIIKAWQRHQDRHERWRGANVAVLAVAPVHYAKPGQMWFLLVLWGLIAVVCLAVCWGREDDQQRRDVDAIDERRALNDAFERRTP